MTTPQAFVHRYEAGAPSLPPLLLLHSEGDDETQLLSLARAIDPQAPVVAVRGRVMSGDGTARFSLPPAGPTAHSGADDDDIAERAAELVEFMEALRKQHRLKAPVAVGHANGAYMAAALLLRHSGALAGAALLRPGQALAKVTTERLDRTPVLMISGKHDLDDARKARVALRQALHARGADLDEFELAAKRYLCTEDTRVTVDWFRRRFH